MTPVGVSISLRTLCSMDIYLIFVVVLFALAASDLIVGVSNDAVNFLNSSIGSQVASRRLIMIVASAGILLGVLFSSGMMEVARKGVFNPEYFSFAHVMVIFMAVMLTDILLLDLFNTFGLPTSTTVSIVFELLGAAVAVSVFHLISTGQGLGNLGSYINLSKATIIVSGIFLSVFIAFTIGLIAQFGTRMLFSFKYGKKVKKYGAYWGGVAMSILGYFIIIKGLKGASFVTESMLAWIKTNTLLIMATNAVVWILAFKLIQRYTEFNILKLIVLSGTFSLALAFSSNDLVNFIGVPVAGFQSFQAWSASEQLPGSFMMDSLGGAVPTPTYLLIIAGAIMIATLWMSKKARTVSATELNLARQGKGSERFKSLWIARVFVRANEKLLEWVYKRLPSKLKNKIKKSYDRTNLDLGSNPPQFDLIRAAVNLTMASMIIALATSYKMPLSTTYVSFMVAMGTSLADRAWGKDSAAQRVSGVFNVIGGWLMTALIAFSVSAIFATIIIRFEMTGALTVFAVVGIAIFFSFKTHSKKSSRESSGLKQGPAVG
jgi:phosphate/sulfate permease